MGEGNSSNECINRTNRRAALLQIGSGFGGLFGACQIEGQYWNSKQKGIYVCKCCGAELFSSESKYDSGSGWPSFYKAIDNQAIEEHEDASHAMVRTEIVCHDCDAHLGHVFEDGPQPTGLRYCVNSASLQLITQEKNDEESYP